MTATPKHPDPRSLVVGVYHEMGHILLTIATVINIVCTIRIGLIKLRTVGVYLIIDRSSYCPWQSRITTKAYYG